MIDPDGETIYLDRGLAAGTAELRHQYGDGVHVHAEPYLLTQLERLCRSETHQPEVNHLIAACYREVFVRVFNREFPRIEVRRPTRMAENNRHGYYQGVVLDPSTRAVSVNIARAGTFPSHIGYEMMNEFLDPTGVRQDHIIMNRITNDEGQVQGAGMQGSKIGGDVEKCVVVFPDPMGATGSSLIHAIQHYKDQVDGTPLAIVNVHLIVTPEYLRAMREAHPEVRIHALRVDRGESDRTVFDSLPGERWDEERGLDDQQYIVPGGGGFGEVLNNSYV